jgi:glycosyltransferase involved in cell wall biosynthesis
MYKSKTLAAVIPCYNEETQIGRVIETMPDYVDHIVIVDDCSKDRTVEVVRGYMNDHPRIVLIRLELNEGVGGAIAAGYEWARDNNIDMAVVMAGDGQMNPDDMPDLLDPVVDEGVNYSKANRLIVNRAIDKVPFVRFFGNSVLSLMTKVASGYWHVSDSQTGYTVADKKVLHTIDWQSMYKRYGQPNDLLIKLNVHNFRVRDVAQEPVYNVGEKSGIKVSKVIFTISNILVKGFFWRMKNKYIIRDFHPLVLFYMFGILLVVLGTVFLIRTLWLLIASGDAPLVSTICMFFMYTMGIQMIFFGMLFDMQDNRELR